MREVATRRSALPGFVVVAAYAALSLVVSTALVLGGVTRRQVEQGFDQQPGQPALPPGVAESLVRAAEIGIPLFSVLSPLLGWVIVSLLMQLATRFFGGAGPLSSMLGVVGVAQVPFLISAVLSALLSGLQLGIGVGTPAGAAIGYLVSLLGLAFLGWHVVLVVIGAAQARGVGYGESAGSCALSCVGLGILIILVVIVAAVGIFATVNAAAP